MSQTVWIARHGNRFDFVQPEWFNTAERRYDPPLSEDGVVQAAKLGQRLKQENISHIYASPFLRSIQTANEVAKILNLPIKLEPGFGEWHNSQWMTHEPETQPQDLLAVEYPLIDWNYKSYLNPKYPESEVDVHHRAGKTIKRLVKDQKSDILIVGHSTSVFGVVKALVSDPPVFKVSLCSLTKIVCNSNDNWDGEFFGDISYLSDS